MNSIKLSIFLNFDSSNVLELAVPEWMNFGGLLSSISVNDVLSSTASLKGICKMIPAVPVSNIIDKIITVARSFKIRSYMI